jgi:hypothetical protein
MTYKTPLRLTILHFEQRFFTDDDTFTITTPLRATVRHFGAQPNFYYTCSLSFRLVFIARLESSDRFLLLLHYAQSEL